MKCSLCVALHDAVIYQNQLYKLVQVNDPNYPGFIRLIANQHVKEITDLSLDENYLIYQALYHIEKTIRQILNPDKINIASLGNSVPHLHWHIIPRFIQDRHFPNPIWGDVTHEKYQPSKDLYKQQTLLIKQLTKLFDNNENNLDKVT